MIVHASLCSHGLYFRTNANTNLELGDCTRETRPPPTSTFKLKSQRQSPIMPSGSLTTCCLRMCFFFFFANGNMLQRSTKIKPRGHDKHNAPVRKTFTADESHFHWTLCDALPGCARLPFSSDRRGNCISVLALRRVLTYTRSHLLIL